MSIAAIPKDDDPHPSSHVIEDVDKIEEQLSIAEGGSGGSSDSLFDSSSDEDDEKSTHHQRSIGGGTVTLEKVATNRDAYGTWKRPLDFTLCLIGYVIGIHNFFRFPHMCYKYGTLTFFIPYIIFTVFVGFPTIFMECTVGQFYGVGSSTAFQQLAPILSGISHLLAWNSFLNCWIFGLTLMWTRSYSGDSLSCLKGWMGCDPGHYFNTPNCYTAVLDDCCSGLSSIADYQQCPMKLKNHSRNNVTDPYAMLFYNHHCISMDSFCALHGWTSIGGKMCRDEFTHKNYSIYDRRTHATTEYLYGFVLGMRKAFVEKSRKLMRKLCSADTGKNCTLDEILDNKDKSKVEKWRTEIFENPKHVTDFWNGNSKYMQLDPESSSFIALPAQAMTTVLFITFFLFVDLLSVSLVTYVMSIVPFGILIFICIQVMGLQGSTTGINDLLSIRGLSSLYSQPELWVDALIQVIITSGVGNGALLSLASFNKYHHSYVFDVLLVTILNVTTSLLATFIVFCTIGHYIYSYGISLPLHEFVRPEFAYSSIDFGFLVYSYLLTAIDGYDFTTLAFFFMLSSFPTDTTIRLAQNMLDTTAQALPRLRFHSAMALLATSFFFLVALLPITRNGGIILFLEFEYAATRFTMPMVMLLEVVALAWVYKAERLLDDSELLGVHHFRLSRPYFIFALKFFAPFVLLLELLYSAAARAGPRINTVSFSPDAKNKFVENMVGWIFSLTPPILLLLSVLKKLTTVPRSDWRELFHPMISWNKVRAAARKQRRQKAREARRLEAIQKLNDPKIRGSIGDIKIKLDKQKRRHRPTIPKTNAVGAEALTSAKPKSSKAINKNESNESFVFEEPKQRSPKGSIAEEIELLRLISEAKKGLEKRMAAVENAVPRGSNNSASIQKNDHPEDDGGVSVAQMSAALHMDGEIPKDTGGDKVSLDSSEVATWKSFIFWNEIIAHLEDWPDRLDESEVESEASSDDTDEDNAHHIHIKSHEKDMVQRYEDRISRHNLEPESMELNKSKV